MNWENGTCQNNFQSYIQKELDFPNSDYLNSVNNITNNHFSDNNSYNNEVTDFFLEFFNNLLIFFFTYHKLFIVLFLIFLLIYKFISMMKEKMLEMELLNPAYMSEKEKEIYFLTRRLTYVNEKHFGKKAETVANKSKQIYNISL